MRDNEKESTNIPKLIKELKIAIRRAEFDEWQTSPVIPIILNRGEEILPAIVELFTDKYYEIRQAGIWLLVELDSPSTREFLIHLLAHKLKEIRVGAAETLGRIGDNDTEIIHALINSLGIRPPNDFVNDTYDYNHAAMEALQHIGLSALPFLKATLQHKYFRMRRDAAIIIGKLGPNASAALPELMQLLDDRKVSMYATIAIGELRSNARAAIPALIERLPTHAGAIQSEIVEALVKIGPATIQPLAQALMMPEYKDVASLAGKVLGRIGPEAIPELVFSFENGSSHVRVATLEAFERIGRPSVGALQYLAKRHWNFHNQNTGKYAEVVSVLRRIDYASVPAPMDTGNG